MEQAENGAVLITTRRRASFAFCLAACFVSEHLWTALSHHTDPPFWFFSLYSEPRWLVAAINLGMCLTIILFIGALAVVCRHCRGGERIYLAAWLIVCLLAPIKDLVSASTATGIVWIQAAGQAVACAAAVYLYRRLPPATAHASMGRLGR
jgi:hypothetical protein